MKIVEKALVELLSAIPNVYVHIAPQNLTDDFVIIQRTTSQRWRSTKAPSGIAQATIQIDCYSKTYYGSKTLGGQVETILDGFRGVVTHDSVNYRIGGLSLQSDGDLLDQSDEPLLFRNILTFLVTYDQ